MEIQWHPSPNFTVGRGNRNIIGIINHITAGLYPGCLNWMCNITASASAHYLVTKSGEIFQMVKEADTAWHAGIVLNPTWKLYDGTNPNRYTLGIEHECVSGGELTEAQYESTLELHKQLCEKYSIPIDRLHIIGHYETDSVNRKNDPGDKFPWQRLMNDLNKYFQKEEVQDVRYNTIDEIPTYARDYVQKLINEGSLAGDGKNLNITEDMIRGWIINERHLKALGVIK